VPKISAVPVRIYSLLAPFARGVQKIAYLDLDRFRERNFEAPFLFFPQVDNFGLANLCLGCVLFWLILSESWYAGDGHGEGSMGSGLGFVLGFGDCARCFTAPTTFVRTCPGHM